MAHEGIWLERILNGWTMDITTDRAYPYVDQLKAIILERFPSAKFDVTPMPDSDEGVAIWAYTNAEDQDIGAIVRERELELLTEKNVFIYVIPLPLEDWRD